MRPKFSTFVLLFIAFLSAQTLNAKPISATLTLNAVSADATEAATAIAELRAQGPPGLSALFQTHAKEIDEQIANPTIAATPEWTRLSAALDAVSQQKDSYLSGLYWYTDFAQAKAAARAAGKPILSLRLLGKLSEEYSCANSRFFRTILYSNVSVSQMLRERFILHWESERPAPRVTIDFGDGRKLERTLTGNSIHYLLDSSGRVVDALPGLYGPAAFMRSLNQVESEIKAQRDNKKSLEPRLPYPRARLNALNVAWVTDIENAGGKIPVGLVVVQQSAGGTPTAVQAARYAMTKVVTEANILKGIMEAPAALETVTDQDTWDKIAQLHIADAQLDARSIGLIKRQTQRALSADGSNGNSDQTFAALLQRLQRNIALDTVRNEYLLHTQLYGWFMVSPDRGDLSKLNKKVYAELFLTPASDPWLGLFSPDVYTALQGGGIRR